MIFTILMGRLTRDPELKYIPSGKAVCKFSIAIDAGTKEKKETLFLDIVTWEKTAEACSTCLHKGAPVMVEGRINVRQWETDAGEKRKAWEIVASNVQFLGSKPQAKPEHEPVDELPPLPDDQDFA